jgi:hypothetical protein
MTLDLDSRLDRLVEFRSTIADDVDGDSEGRRTLPCALCSEGQVRLGWQTALEFSEG